MNRQTRAVTTRHVLAPVAADTALRLTNPRSLGTARGTPARRSLLTSRKLPPPPPPLPNGPRGVRSLFIFHCEDWPRTSRACRIVFVRAATKRRQNWLPMLKLDPGRSLAPGFRALIARRFSRLHENVQQSSNFPGQRAVEDNNEMSILRDNFHAEVFRCSPSV